LTPLIYDDGLVLFRNNCFLVQLTIQPMPFCPMLKLSRN